MISPLNKGASQGGGVAPSGNQVVALRVAIIGAVLLGLFAIVFFRLWYLQVLSGESLSAAASQNRNRSVPITAPRGEIVDRNGTVIVRNRRAQIVELSPGSLPMLERQVANEYGQALGEWSQQVEAKVVQRYGEKRAAKFKKTPQWAIDQTPRPQITPLNDPELLRDYAEDGDEKQLAELVKRYERLGWLLDLPPAEIRRRVIKSLYLLPYGNVPLRKNGATEEVVNYIAENAEQFPGVTTTTKSVRSYPLSGAGAQLFGQVGPVPVDEDGESTIRKYRKLNTAAQVGLNGLELQYDGNLRGRDGQVKARIDAFGNVQGEPERIAPIPGDKLQLTLDAKLHAYTQDVLGGEKSTFNSAGNPGAAVAMDPRNGEILALASHPTFDPADFVRGVSDEEFERFINEEGDKPLFNRVTDGYYAAGSTFKPVTAFAAVADGQVTPTDIIQDNGKMEISDQPFQNAGGIPAGPVDLVKSMQVSSDIYYYTMGARLNDEADQLQKWTRRLGFGTKTGIDLPGENRGIVPDRKWRQGLADQEGECRRSKKPPIPEGPGFSVYEAARRGCGLSDQRTWSIGDNVQLAIGQGDLGITPLQNAVMYAAIENGGTLVRPHLAKEVQDRNGATRQTFQFKPRRKPVDLQATGALDAVRTGLAKAAMEPGGTSAPVFENWPKDRFPVYGKTGTVQKTGKQDQSWYACYVPHPTKPIVVVVTVEDGGYGAESAAPIAGQMLAKWFNVTDAEIKAGDSATR
ncbi:MAG: hypothetical protein JHD16_05980 [Solirubrobacteraceae bacterium]|nr:hypothetical protein [Solirubrobacteraceae bacterium]